MANLTFLDLQNMVFRLMRDNSQVKYDLPTIKKWLNDAERRYCSFTSFAGEKNTSIATVATTQEYTLPGGFVREKDEGVFLDGLRLTKIRQAKTIEDTTQNATPTMYYVRQKSIGLYPIPVAIQTLTLLYITMGGDMIADGNYPIIPDEHQELLVSYACKHCCLEGEDDRFQAFRTDWINGLNDARIEVMDKYYSNVVLQSGAGGPVLDPVDHDSVQLR